MQHSRHYPDKSFPQCLWLVPHLGELLKAHEKIYLVSNSKCVPTKEAKKLLHHLIHRSRTVPCDGVAVVFVKAFFTAWNVFHASSFAKSLLRSDWYIMVLACVSYKKKNKCNSFKACMTCMTLKRAKKLTIWIRNNVVDILCCVGLRVSDVSGHWKGWEELIVSDTALRKTPCVIG